MAKLLLIAALGAVAWWWLRPYLVPRRTSPPRFERHLDEAEARAILGLGADDGPEAIRAAHRRLAAAVHPDRGGSTELMRRINLARDTLLNNASD